MTTWTEAYVHTFVTDSGALRDGQKLAQAGKWTGSGQNALAAWGLAQGSAKEPYKVCLELATGATKCSCPSRKFPCKHGVALMLLLAQGAVETQSNTPEWVASWIEGRQRRQEAAPAAEKQPDIAAQAKREAARLSKVAGGIDELRLFLEDLARQGLEDRRIRTYEFWDRIASRMVDAQMSSVAQRLRILGGKPFQKRADWSSQMAAEIGRLYALTEAYGRLDSLPDGLQHDVRTALGFSLKQEEILATQPAIRSLWQIVGQTSAFAERLTERRTWLYSADDKRYALLLDFSHSSRPFSSSYPVGHTFEGEVVFYPGAYPQRALLKTDRPTFRRDNELAAFAFSSTDELLDAHASALAENPFLERFPAGFASAYPTRSAITDPSDKALPLDGAPNTQWLQAIVGGDWLPIFGEWDGEAFTMATVVTAEGWISVKNA